jgi:uncharacterized protein
MLTSLLNDAVASTHYLTPAGTPASKDWSPVFYFRSAGAARASAHAGDRRRSLPRPAVRVENSLRAVAVAYRDRLAWDFPNADATVRALVGAGADVNAPFEGRHAETALHWAASSDDVDALDALLDAGADIEAPGSVIGGGTALADAVAFGQWNAARRLLERGARTTLWQEAALGLMDRVETRFAGSAPPAPEEITNAFWCACHGGQRRSAEFLLDRGADLNWVGHNKLTPLDVAQKSGAGALAEWLRDRVRLTESREGT